VDVDVDAATLLGSDDDAPLLPDPDDRHQLCPPLPWLPDVVRHGCVTSCGVLGLAVGACCAHSVRGGAR